MRVLIVGGTSFFGKLIVRAFLDRGNQVSVYTRGRRRPDFLDVVEHLRGDRTDHAGFVRALSDRSFDVVVDNIAFLRPDVEATVRAFGGRIGHYILTSSGSVYPRFSARPPFQPIVEEAADLSLRGDDDYSEGKRTCEQAALEQNLFPVTIIRPPIVQGPEDPSRRGWFWYQRIADGGPVLVPLRSPSSVWRQACSRDIAAAVLLAAGNPAAFGKTYNIAGDEILTLEDFARLVADILEKGDPVVSVPAAVLKRDAPWYRPTFAHWFVMDTTKVKADLGFAPIPLPQWLAETVRWHLAAALPPAEGYDRRGAEIALARRAQAAPQDA
ncbi:MAG TPA: NAD-dependent epimerase/dehydratase family protein [bacterium]|jgi:nucleoside-diphosphate-sugar epimerase|nr:NAD-dependent epimerase/dehydratase family protein [bacterium]